MSRFVNPVPQFGDLALNPLSKGKLFFFESGTNDDKKTFADVNETIENTQPVLLLGDGRVPNIFYSGSAKVTLTDSDEAQIWSKDPVTTGGDSGEFADPWDAITIYNINGVVDLNSDFYVSIINNNQNNNPATTPAAWTQFDLLKRWNTNETYGVGDPVTATDSLVYISLISPNTGNDPITSPAEWNTVTGKINVVTFTVGGTYNPPDGVKSLKFTPIGAGGGGGGIDGQGASTAAASAGGGGGGTTIITTSIIDASYSVVIGAGGAGGASGNNSGAEGGNTTVIGATISLTGNGGAGGVGDIGVAGVGTSLGADGRPGSGGDLNFRGSDSSSATVISGDVASSSLSGASSLGGSVRATNDADGRISSTPGVGGGGVFSSGVTSNRGGGDGADGIVIIEEFF